MSADATLVHATAVALGGHGILLTGKSGSGKSDLALRLIDRGARLISDDMVVVTTTQGGLRLSAPANIEGKIEIRGVGIVDLAEHSTGPLRLIVDLESAPERLPRDLLTQEFCNFAVPVVHIEAFKASAALKVEYALRHVIDARRWPVPTSLSQRKKAT